jgi:hypothetical protein
VGFVPLTHYDEFSSSCVVSCVAYWRSLNLRGYSSDLFQTFVVNFGYVRVSREEIMTNCNSLSRRAFAHNVDVLLLY